MKKIISLLCIALFGHYNICAQQCEIIIDTSQSLGKILPKKYAIRYGSK